MQREIEWLCPGSIPARLSGQTRHFGSITSLLPVFPHYYHHCHYYIHFTLLLLLHYYLLLG